MSLDNDGYKVGRRGGSIFSTNDALGWAAGDLARKNAEALAAAPTGEEHPNAWQIFILAAVVGMGEILLVSAGLLPSFLTASLWYLVPSWLVATTVAYFVLRALPDLVSGLIMGVPLGGAAGWLAWQHLEHRWAIAIGLGVGAVIYLFFSTLE